MKTTRVGETPSTVGYRELVRRWFQRFGPGTEEDIVWWFGSAVSAVRTALLELEAVKVSLEGGSLGWLLPDDVDESRVPELWCSASALA